MIDSYLEWQHQGCDTDLSRDFLNFGDGDFSFEIPFKNYFKIVFFCFGVEIHPVLELQFLTLLHVDLFCFATQSVQIAL